ncbi:MAG TPA: diguanylate cyclase, partial [Candidatus Omnitrophica bacterium]|nr:diguanylate cyclase [Candidatus Omnitrophota bacterium]
MDNEKLFSKDSNSDIRFEKPTFIDPLTGLFNRYYLYEFLPQEIKKSQASNYSLGIFIIDLDNFKELNDKYGHLAGDDILKQFSEFLKKSRRQTDMVIRYAGDEFMVLLPGVDREKGLMLGERLIKQISENTITLKNKKQIHLTVSIGLSLCPDDASDVDHLIDLADKALYLAKEKGRNQVIYAQQVTSESVAFQIALDSFPCPKFIDRDEEMTRFKQMFNDNVLGKGILESVFISAGSGLGKSRLIREFNEHINKKAVVLSAKGIFKYKEEPYYLFISGLDDYLSKVGLNSLDTRELFAALSGEELTELSKVLPQIEQFSGSYPETKQARSVLFKAFLNLLIVIGRNSPLVISFDDLQWADKASLELVHYLIEYEKKRKIFIMLGFKEAESSGTSETNRVRQLLNYLCDIENVIELKLTPFTLRDTSEMIEAMFPGLKQIKEISNLVFNITKGNPAFIEEIFKSLAENKLLSFNNDIWSLKKGLDSVSIPHSLQETIRKRLKGMDKETKELIIQAAVIGDDFSVDLLRRIGDKNEGYIFEVMSRAKKMHLINEKEKTGKFNFISKDIQNALYDELDEKQRSEIHEKISNTLAKEHENDLYNVASELSFHAAQVAGGTAAAKYRGLIKKKADGIFNPAELMDYLKEFVKEEEVLEEEEDVEEIKVALSPAVNIEITRLIRTILSAIKNFQLYPSGSSIRDDFVDDIYKSAGLVLEQIPKLKIIESEGILVINGRRLSVREAQEWGGHNLVSLMIEINMKSLAFIRGVTKEEISSFIDIVNKGRQYVDDNHGWKKIVTQNKLAHIKIDEFSYERIVTPSRTGASKRKKFEDAMMMEFLLGQMDNDQVDRKTIVSKMFLEPKKFAEAMEKIAKKAGKNTASSDTIESLTEAVRKVSSQLSQDKATGPDVIGALSKVILELDWKLKNKFIRESPEIIGADKKRITARIIENIPEEELLNLIEQSLRHGLTSPLAVKDLIEKAIPDKEKRKKMASKISTKLHDFGVDEDMVRCLTGKISWAELPIERRL